MLAELRPALMITRREVRDQMRDWRIIIPIVVLTVFFPALMNFTAERAVNFVGNYGADIVAERLIPFLLMVVGFFPASFSLIIALESFVGEKERGSIEPLLASPLSDLQLYLGKLMAVMVPPLLASYLGITIYLVRVYRDLGWIPEIDLLLQILALTFVQTLTMVSGAVVISTQATSVRAANLLASFIIVPMSLLIQGESLVMFWGQYNILWFAVLGMVIIASLLVRTGVGHFNREELLGREIDVINIKWSWHLFSSAFKGKANSIWSWYRLEVIGLLKVYRFPASLMFLMVIASLLVGANLTKQFVIPPEMINVGITGGQLSESLDQLSIFSASGIWVILFHNIQVILLAAILGIFTYGVFGILVLMLPMILIGYFLATVSTAGISAVTFFGAFILPHGIFEIPAIILASASILHLGATLAAPSGGVKIGEGLIISIANWTKIMLGIILPLFLLAAITEALITPRIALIYFGN